MCAPKILNASQVRNELILPAIHDMDIVKIHTLLHIYYIYVILATL